jgi:hypothetical protein
MKWSSEHFYLPRIGSEQNSVGKIAICSVFFLSEIANPPLDRRHTGRQKNSELADRRWGMGRSQIIGLIMLLLLSLSVI